MQLSQRNTLSKSERLCSERRIEGVFKQGRRGSVEPLRFCWLASPAGATGTQEDGAAVSVLFSVPKKAFKKAWKRNVIKRRMRESYRVRKHGLIAATEAAGRHIDIALICHPADAPHIPDYGTIDHAVAKILDKILARS